VVEDLGAVGGEIHYDVPGSGVVDDVPVVGEPMDVQVYVEEVDCDGGIEDQLDEAEEEETQEARGVEVGGTSAEDGGDRGAVVVQAVDDDGCGWLVRDCDEDGMGRIWDEI
jgi:hypothetical protein